MRRILTLVLTFFCVTSWAATDVLFDLASPYFNAYPASNRTVTLQPLAPYPGNLVTYTSGPSGTFVASNLFVTDYDGVIKERGSAFAISFKIGVTATNLGLIRAETITIGASTNPVSGRVPYSMAASDARYATLATATNIAASVASRDGSTLTNLAGTLTASTGISITTNALGNPIIAATGEAEAVVPTNAITGWISDTNSANLITTTNLVIASTNGLVPANVLTNKQTNVVISGNFSGYGTNLLLWRNADSSLQRFLGYWGPGQWGTNATNFAILTTRSADQYTGRVLYVGEETFLRGISLQVGNSNSLSDANSGQVDPRITLSMGFTDDFDHEIQWRFEEYTLTDGLHQPLLSYEESNSGRVWLGNTNGLGRVTARGIFDSPTNIISGGSFYGSALGLTNYPATNLLKGATGSAGQILTATVTGVVWSNAPAVGGLTEFPYTAITNSPWLTNNQQGVTLGGTFSGEGSDLTYTLPTWGGGSSDIVLYDEVSERLYLADGVTFGGTNMTVAFTGYALSAATFSGSAQSLTNLPPSGITDAILNWGGPTNSIPCTNATLFYASATDVLLSTVTGSATGRKQWASLAVSNSSAGNITLRVTNALWRAIGTGTTNALVIPGSKVGLLSVECWGTFQLYGTAVQQ
jgi:hypothetical protein